MALLFSNNGHLKHKPLASIFVGLALTVTTMASSVAMAADEYSFNFRHSSTEHIFVDEKEARAFDDLMKSFHELPAFVTQSKKAKQITTEKQSISDEIIIDQDDDDMPFGEANITEKEKMDSIEKLYKKMCTPKNPCKIEKPDLTGIDDPIKPIM